MSKHCPLCGRGLSAKYRREPHDRYMRRRLRRFWLASQPPRRIPCRYVPPMPL
jgi:hypothetical protein